MGVGSGVGVAVGTRVGVGVGSGVGVAVGTRVGVGVGSGVGVAVGTRVGVSMNVEVVVGDTRVRVGLRVGIWVGLGTVVAVGGCVAQVSPLKPKPSRTITKDRVRIQIPSAVKVDGQRGQEGAHVLNACPVMLTPIEAPGHRRILGKGNDKPCRDRRYSLEHRYIDTSACASVSSYIRCRVSRATSVS